MKRTIIKLFITGLSITIFTAHIHAGLLSGVPEGKQKAPLVVKTIQGNPSTRYSVVETIITSNPTKAGDPKKLIQRSELGIIKPEGNAINRNVTLQVPQLGFDIKTNLTDIVPEIVGAVSPNPADLPAYDEKGNPNEAKQNAKANPKQVIAAAAGSLVDEGLAFLSKQLNKGYGNQQKEIRMLELIPSKYYEIDAKNNTIIVKGDFQTDLPFYLQAQATILPIADKLNKVKVEYNKMYKTWQDLEKQKKFDESDKYVDQMDNYREKTIVPLEKQFVTAAQDVEKYSMHRILIMNDPEGPDDSCQEGLQGRWNFLVYFYLGAKQTNRIKVSFCVPDVKEPQGMIVDLARNKLVTEKNGEFRLKDGGITFMSTEDKKNITFPADIESGRVAWSAPRSETINWFRSMVTSADGSDLNALMFPFDLLQIAKDMKAQEDEEGKKRWDKVRKATKTLKDSGGLPKKDAAELDELVGKIPPPDASEADKNEDESESAESDDETSDEAHRSDVRKKDVKKKSGSALSALSTIGDVLLENKDKLLQAGKDLASATKGKSKKKTDKKADTAQIEVD